MPLNKQEIKVLERKAHEMRSLCVDTVSWAGGEGI